MKKIGIILLTITMALILALTPKTHAYTLSNQGPIFYNQVTDTVGTADLLDIGTTFIEYMYYDLGTSTIDALTVRLVFSENITTELLSTIHTNNKLIRIYLNFYNSTNVILYSHNSTYNQSRSFSYYETNFYNNTAITNISYFTLRIENYDINANEDLLHKIMHNAILVRGDTVINQTITNTQYANGWNDAMNSKVTQIWSLWGNIFDTFMSVFNVFSIKLMGDITIGHIALVPLVLGLIGFIYSLGGKRGR